MSYPMDLDEYTEAQLTAEIRKRKELRAARTEGGAVKPGLDTLRKLAEALGDRGWYAPRGRHDDGHQRTIAVSADEFDYIVAASPDVVLGLIGEITAARDMLATKLPGFTAAHPIAYGIRLLAQQRDDARRMLDERDAVRVNAEEAISAVVGFTPSAPKSPSSHPIASGGGADASVVDPRDAEITRLRDLVRHQRGALHDEGLIDDAEYAALAADAGAVARLQDYDEVRAALSRRNADIAVLRDILSGSQRTFASALAGRDAEVAELRARMPTEPEAVAILAWVAKLEGVRAGNLIRSLGPRAEEVGQREADTFTAAHPDAPTAFRKLEILAGAKAADPAKGDK